MGGWPQGQPPGFRPAHPQRGIDVPAETRAELERRLAGLAATIDRLTQKRDPAGDRAAPRRPDLLEGRARRPHLPGILRSRGPSEGKDSAGRRKAGQDPRRQSPFPRWTKQTGLVVRGYVSKIDGSVQPYGLVDPGVLSDEGPGKVPARRLVPRPGRDPERGQLPRRAAQAAGRVHAGRHDRPASLRPLLQRQQVRRRGRRPRGDRRRSSAATGSTTTGSRSAASRWAARPAGSSPSITPTAGSPPTPGPGSPRRRGSSRSSRSETLKPTWYEQKLWHLYDCTDYAANLLQCPTVAYSGEIDSQKQAADVMAEALKTEGIDADPHHRPEDQARLSSRRQERGRAAARQPRRAGPRAVSREVVDFVTYTLKYNQMNWVTIDGLGEHWERARVRADARRPTASRS